VAVRGCVYPGQMFVLPSLHPPCSAAVPLSWLSLTLWCMWLIYLMWNCHTIGRILNPWFFLFLSFKWRPCKMPLGRISPCPPPSRGHCLLFEMSSCIIISLYLLRVLVWFFTVVVYLSFFFVLFCYRPCGE